MSSGFTPTYQLPYPIQTDPVNVAGDMQDLAEGVELALNLKASLASPALTGIPIAPTPSVDTNTTQLATTAYVIGQGYLKSSDAASTYATLTSPSLTGNPTAPTQALGNNTTRIATTAFVKNELDTLSTLPSQTGANGSFLTSNGSNAFWKNLVISDILGLESTFTDLASLYSPLNVVISSKTSNYTLESTDSSRQIEMNMSVANTVTIPKDLALPVGASVIIVQTGSGQTSIVAATDVTINATPGLKLRTQWSVATITKRAPNTWLLAGDIVA